MPRHSYREHDYSFGQAMLTLRLTQAGLADLLGISRRAVGEWEAGSTYPKEEHLQHLIALCMRQHVFAPEREEAEIRALWNTAHQRMQLDETWLAAVLARPSAAPTPVGQTGAAAVTTPPAPVQPSPPAEEPAASPRVDWVGALDVSHFSGREVEVAELSQWIVQERCRLVALLGSRLGSQFEAVL